MDKSRITCPQCNHVSEVEMPTNRSVTLVDCPNCLTRLRPKSGHCCVPCSYGDKHCPACRCFENQSPAAAGSPTGQDSRSELETNEPEESNQ